MLVNGRSRDSLLIIECESQLADENKSTDLTLAQLQAAYHKTKLILSFFVPTILRQGAKTRVAIEL